MGQTAATPADGGFALVFVILLCGLLSLLALTFASAARVHVRLSENLLANAAAEAMADSGVQIGLIRLAAAGGDGRATVPPVTVCELPGGERLALTISDEAGRVDLNLASAELLVALFKGSGVQDDNAQRLADAIIDYRDRDDERRSLGAERDDYEAAGANARPKNAPFAVLEEVRGVLGMSNDIFEAVRPFSSVHSGQLGIDPRAAPDALIATLARGVGLPEGSGLPRDFTAVTTSAAFLVRAAVVTVGGAAAVREVVATVAPKRSTPPLAAGPDPGFGTRARPRRSPGEATGLEAKILEWRSGSLSAKDRDLVAGDRVLAKC